MRNTYVAVSDQITRVLITLTIIGAVAIAAFAWWAAGRVDENSLGQQRHLVEVGLTDAANQLPLEQNSSAIWDDAVTALRAGDDVWIAANLAEWMSEYFGHHNVYVLNADDSVMRAVENGTRMPAETFEPYRPVLEPLVRTLRQQMAAASAGQADSTESIRGLDVQDEVKLPDGTVGIASIVPVIPSTPAVRQAPGTEYLLVSIRVLDQKLSDTIGGKFFLAGLGFRPEMPASLVGPVVAVHNDAGETLGYFSWSPFRPALALLREMYPAMAVAALGGVLLLVFLIRRLRRTSTMLEESEGNATFLAFHDPLTGLPNRALFVDRLNQAFANARSSGKAFALHSIDLDRFKPINDTMGHPAGDELLRQVAARLKALTAEIDTVARVGGDEFSIIQVGLQQPEDVVLLAQQIIAELERPFNLSGQEALVGGSVGVAISQDGSGDADDLLRQADVALYEVKTSGRGRYQMFAGNLDLAVQERRSIELDLRAALAGEPGLELVYQPIYSANGGEIVGAESLVRWNNPRRGRLSPATFIPLAEERGLIDQLGLWVLREACAFTVTSPLPWVAVNVSPLQFRSERFADYVFRILREVGLEPERLEIEITEGLLLQNSPEVQATLNKLRASGVRVALDDFGTGYSSISYLRTHGVDKLKIDQSFVVQLGKDEEIGKIVRCIIDLAAAMRMKVTAEGVETVDQADLLRAMGCDQLQGFLLSRPVAAATVGSLITGS